ncbi:MAG: hypothetical protein QW197_01825 [Candidatus Aenigmatarchaeota archaeon]
MEKYGINVEKLKGSVWVYRVDGEKLENINVDRNILLRNFVIALVGSRDSNKEKEAYNLVIKFVEKEKLNRAIGLVRSNKELIKKILELYKQDKIEEILKVLEEFSENYKDKQSGEFLHDIVQVIKNYKPGRISGNYLIGFYGKHVVSMFSNYSTMCCALLPEGANRYAAVTYILDPRIVLISYKFVNEFEKGKELYAVREEGEVDGIVIAYIAKRADTNEPILIVDSVEGGREFRNFVEKNYKLIKQDIERVAKEIGCKYVVYNVKTFNETPRVFLEKIKKEIKVSKIKIDIIGDSKIPYAYSKRYRQYLEIFNGWNVPKGIIKGYIYKI